MAKYEVLRFGDYNGVGAILKVTTIFGSKTWTQFVDRGRPANRWVCRETGEHKHGGILWAGDLFYKARYLTQEAK